MGWWGVLYISGFQSLFLLDERRYGNSSLLDTSNKKVSILVFIGWAKVPQIQQSARQSLSVSILVFIGWAKVLCAPSYLLFRASLFQSLFLLDERRYSLLSENLKGIICCFNPCFYWMSEGTPLLSLLRVQSLRFQSLFLLDERRYSEYAPFMKNNFSGFNPCFYWMSEGTFF